MTARHAGPPYRRYTGWPNRSFVWKVSAWDHHAHAYLTFGDVTSQAVCGHNSSSTTLDDDDGAAIECLGCMLVLVRMASEGSTVDERNPAVGYTFTLPAEPGSRFAQDAFAAAIGLRAVFQAGDMSREAMTLRAAVEPGGLSARVTVDVDLSDLAGEPGGISIAEAR